MITNSIEGVNRGPVEQYCRRARGCSSLRLLRHHRCTTRTCETSHILEPLKLLIFYNLILSTISPSVHWFCMSPAGSCLLFSVALVYWDIIDSTSCVCQLKRSPDLSDNILSSIDWRPGCRCTSIQQHSSTDCSSANNSSLRLGHWWDDPNKGRLIWVVVSKS